MIFAKTLSAAVFSVLVAGSASVAQMTPPSTSSPTNPSSPSASDRAPAPIPGSSAPTVVQCNQGHSESMAMSKEQFAKACVEMKAKNSGG